MIQNVEDLFLSFQEIKNWTAVELQPPPPPPFNQWFGESFSCHLNSISNGIINVFSITSYMYLGDGSAKLPCPWDQGRKMTNYGPNKSLDFKLIFLSVQKIIKLWLLQLQPPPSPFNQWFGDSFSCHTCNLNSVSTLLGFSESLKRNLSNGVINVHIGDEVNSTNLPWIIAHGPKAET